MASQVIQSGIKGAPPSVAEAFERTLPTVNDLLSQNSTKFDIEYGDLKFSNHLSHGLVALWAVGGSEELLKGFYRAYTTRNHYNMGQLLPIEPPRVIPTSKKEVLTKWRGKRENYSGLLAFFKDQLSLLKKENEATALKRLLLEYVPSLIDGVAGSAFHGAIQVGYGLEIPHETAVLEGLAYWTMIHRPSGVLLPEPTTFLRSFSTDEHGIRDPVELLSHVRQSFVENFGNALPDDIEKLPRFNGKVTAISHRFAFLLNRADYGVRNLVDRASDNETKQRIIDVAIKKMLYAIVKVYGCSKDDFFVLHLITAGRSLRTILNALTEDNHENFLFKARAIDYYWRATVASYLSQHFPELDSKWFEIPADVPSWEQIIAKSHDSLEKDEHEYKLLFVLYYFSHEKYFVDGDESDSKIDKLLRLITARKVELLPWELSS